MKKVLIFIFSLAFSITSFALTCEEYINNQFDKAKGYPNSEEQVEQMRIAIFTSYPSSVSWQVFKMQSQEMSERNAHTLSLLVYSNARETQAMANRIFKNAAKEIDGLKSLTTSICKDPNIEISKAFEIFLEKLTDAISEDKKAQRSKQ